LKIHTSIAWVMIGALALCSCSAGSANKMIPISDQPTSGTSKSARLHTDDIADCTFFYQESTPGVEDPSSDTLLGVYCSGGSGGTGSGYQCTGKCYSSTVPPNPPTKTRAQKILAAAQSRLGTKTGKGSKIASLLNGTACAYMIGLIVDPFVSVALSTWVPTMVNQMDADTADFTQLTPDSNGQFLNAQPGDIVVEDGADYADANDPDSPAQSHVGICANQGCTQIYSNSDSQGQFMNNFHNGPNMNGYPSTIYHVNG